MRVLQILEAKASSKYKHEEKQLKQTPRLQREGDFVWHLYKFFEVENSTTATRKNPDYRKALRQLVTEVVKEWVAKHSKTHPKWKNININKAVTDIIEGIYEDHPAVHPDDEFGPFDPAVWMEYMDDDYTEDQARADYEAEYQDSLQRYEQDVARQQRQGRWTSADHAGRYIRGHWGKKRQYGENAQVPKQIRDQVGALVKEVMVRLRENEHRLPPKEFKANTILEYEPKDVKPYFKDDDGGWLPLSHATVKIDEKGNIKFVRMYTKSKYDSNAITIKKIQDLSPAELRERIKYYKEHADW